MEQFESKVLGGQVVEYKEATINGQPVGVIDCYIATWDPDTGGIYGIPDRFEPGAFRASLQEHRDRNDRQVRLKDHHKHTVGGFPIATVFEDAKGLRAIGHINLVTQRGRELWSLIQQGVLTDMSVGFKALSDRIVDGIRVISQAILWEGSVVDEPANQAATILEAKAVVPFKDLPLASRDRAWDAAAAIKRVRSLVGAEDAPNTAYRDAFLWYDSDAAGDFGSYKLPIADAIDGSLVAVPRAIFGAAAALSGGRGGVDVPEADRAGLIRNIERYYAKMDMESPFQAKSRQFYGVDEVKSLEPDELEAALRRGAAFSKGAARYVIARRAAFEPLEVPTLPPLADAADRAYAVKCLQDMQSALRGCIDDLKG